MDCAFSYCVDSYCSGKYSADLEQVKSLEIGFISCHRSRSVKSIRSLFFANPFNLFNLTKKKRRLHYLATLLQFSFGYSLICDATLPYQYLGTKHYNPKSALS